MTIPGEEAGEDPQATDLPLDAHLHTDQSPDSRVPIDVYAAQAEARGITELAITDHVDFDARDPAYDYVAFAVRERTVREAAERWAPRGVVISFGAELTMTGPIHRTYRAASRPGPAAARSTRSWGRTSSRSWAPPGRASSTRSATSTT